MVHVGEQRLQPRRAGRRVTPTLPHRPYAVRGARKTSNEPSVTTVLGLLLNKPGLAYAAAREASTFAVLHQDRWVNLATEHAIDTLRKHPFGIWDGRAAMGTLVHAVNEAYCAGEEVDLEALIAHVIENDTKAKVWRNADRDDLLERALGYVLGLEAWWTRFSPTHIQSEVVVRWPKLFIGQADLRCTIDTTWADGFQGPQDTLIDCKTTSIQDEDKGVYPEVFALQLAGYGMAREAVTYGMLEDASLVSGWRVVESGVSRWTHPERYAVIHLRGDEGFTFYEVPVDRATERTFLRLARAYPVVSSLAKTDLGRIPPFREEAVA